jgi:hypothetical protein
VVTGPDPRIADMAPTAAAQFSHFTPVSLTATNSTLTSSATAVTAGQSVTLTTTVAAADTSDPAAPVPTGQVTFMDGSQVVGTAPLVNGTATFTDTISTSGPHAFQADYAGDGSTFDQSASPAVTVTADPAAATVALSTSATTANPGDAVTFAATVTPASPGLPAPTGVVTFFDGTTVLGTGTVTAGVATYQTSSLLSGAHSIGAMYGGDPTFASGDAAPLTETVNTTYTVGLTVPPTSPTFGQPVTLTAHVTPSAGGSLPPGAMVAFRDGTTTLGTAAVNDQGDATLTVKGLGGGAHNLTAVFTAGTSFVSDAVTLNVQKATTAASIRSTDPTAQKGEPVTLTVNVMPPAGGMTAPTGTVTFKDGATVLGSAPVANGKAVLRLSNLAVGSHPVTATYQGDANYKGSSAAMTQTVAPAAVTTTTTLQSSDRSAVVGEQIALTAHVVPSVGSATPTGPVTFKDGSKVLGATLIDRTGKALLLTNSLGMGTHTITATFGGSGNFTGSTSAPVTVSVRLGSRTTLASSAPAIVATQGVTLTATVGAAAGGAVQPAGSVTFYDGTKAIGTAAVQNGVARFTTGPFTAVGIHRIAAAYNGNGMFANSSSGVVYLNVGAAGTTTTLLPPGQPATANGMMTLRANVAVVPPGTGKPIGKVTFFDGSTALGSATVTDGKAELHTPKLAAGIHNLRAYFTGTGSYAGSSSAIVRYTTAATTATALAAPPAAFGQATALKATVSVLTPGFGSANGRVTFRDGATVLGSATLLNGVATLGVRLGTGSHHLTASYDGTAAFAASATAPLAYTVAKATPTEVLNASPGAPRAGVPVTVRADFGPAAFGAAKPTGTVKLTDGSTVLGTFPLGPGPVIFQTSTLAKGTHALTATYSGDANYSAATANLALMVA